MTGTVQPLQSSGHPPLPGATIRLSGQTFGVAQTVKDSADNTPVNGSSVANKPG